METLSFETIIFSDRGDHVEGLFLNIFSFKLPKEVLLSIGNFSVGNNSISFEAENSREKFNALLDEALLNLTNVVTKKKTVYVHKNSGIPLIGDIAFGLIDRGTNIIEVRPISGCNIRCVYCSVDEDKRDIDFVVDADYLVAEFRKLVEFKNVAHVEAHIASQGEPTMYADLPRLIAGIRKIHQVKTISIDTNGILLTKSKIDELIKAGLSRVNFSINAIDDKTAKKIADVGDGYNIQKVLETAKYLSDHVELIIAPVFVQGWNDDELEKIVEFTKSLKNEKFTPKCYIQNFLNYRFGKNPAKSVEFDAFFEKLKLLEQKHKIKLIIDKTDFNIIKTKSLPKPFKEGDVVRAKTMSVDRLPNEVLAVAKDRIISVFNLKKQGMIDVSKNTNNANKQVVLEHVQENTKCIKLGRFIDVKITGDKHNIFYGVVV